VCLCAAAACLDPRFPVRPYGGLTQAMGTYEPTCINGYFVYNKMLCSNGFATSTKQFPNMNCTGTPLFETVRGSCVFVFVFVCVFVFVFCLYNINITGLYMYFSISIWYGC